MLVAHARSVKDLCLQVGYWILKQQPCEGPFFGVEQKKTQYLRTEFARSLPPMPRKIRASKGPGDLVG